MKCFFCCKEATAQIGSRFACTDCWNKENSETGLAAKFVMGALIFIFFVAIICH